MHQPAVACSSSRAELNKELQVYGYALMALISVPSSFRHHLICSNNS